jgi:hypothetical protein
VLPPGREHECTGKILRGRYKWLRGTSSLKAVHPLHLSRMGRVPVDGLDQLDSRGQVVKDRHRTVLYSGLAVFSRVHLPSRYGIMPEGTKGCWPQYLSKMGCTARASEPRARALGEEVVRHRFLIIEEAWDRSLGGVARYDEGLNRRHLSNLG